MIDRYLSLRWISWIAIAAIFGSVLFGIDRLAFRDISHFYTPLYDYVAQRCQKGYIPLWNPLDHTGIPLLGETTTAVLYPIRWLVFSLPMPTDVAMAWYVVIHLLIASYSATVIARRAGVSINGATIAGICYPLSGSVLFLYTNPPFLVGAAWMPLVLSRVLYHQSELCGGSKGERSSAFRVIKQSTVTGAVMSMMILGGDPQAVLHCMILAGGILLVRWTMSINDPKKPFRLAPSLISLVVACLVTTTLSLPQIASSISWSAQSNRVRHDDPVTAFGIPENETAKDEAFRYSVPPWHVAELVSPHVFGSLLPQNTRVSLLIPGESRTWTPTLFMGILVCVALLSRLASIRLHRMRKGFVDLWSAIAIATLFLSMGHFGVVWLFQQFTDQLDTIDSAAFGPYWMLYEFFPFYDSFRYPAKWLPFFALACSILTAKWFDQFSRTKLVTTKIVCLVVAGFCAVAFIVLTWFAAQTAWQQPVPTDEFWGPLDVVAGLNEGRWSLVQTFFVLAITYVLLNLRLRRRVKHRTLQIAFHIVLAIELTIVGSGVVYRVDRGIERKILASPTITQRQSNLTTMRTRSGTGWPLLWRTTQSRQRLAEVESSQRISWFGRWHLKDRGHVFNSMTSIQSQSMHQFWRATNDILRKSEVEEHAAYWKAIRNSLNVGQVIHSNDSSQQFKGLQLINTDCHINAPLEDDTFRLDTRWRSIDGNPKLYRELLERLASIKHNIDNIPVVFDAPSPDREGVNEHRMDNVSVESPEHVSVRIATSGPVLLSRSTLQDGNWVARLEANDTDKPLELPVYCVDWLRQGCVVPPGQWTIHFVYAPTWLTWTVAVWVLAWIFFAILAVANIILVFKRKFL